MSWAGSRDASNPIPSPPIAPPLYGDVMVMVGVVVAEAGDDATASEAETAKTDCCQQDDYCPTGPNLPSRMPPLNGRSNLLATSAHMTPSSLTQKRRGAWWGRQTPDRVVPSMGRQVDSPRRPTHRVEGPEKVPRRRSQRCKWERPETECR